MKNFFFFFFFFSFFLFEQKINSKINFINKILDYSRKNKKTVFGFSTLLGITSYSLYKIINNKYKYEQNDDKKLNEVNKLIQNWFEIPKLINDPLKNHLEEMKNNLISGISSIKLKIDQENQKQEDFSLFFIDNKEVKHDYSNLIFFKKNENFILSQNGILLKEQNYDKKSFTFCEISDENKSELNEHFFNETNNQETLNFRNSIKENFKSLSNYSKKKEINDFGLKINFDEDNFIIVDVDFLKEKPLFYEKLTKNIKEQYKKTLEKIYKIEIPEDLLKPIKNKKLTDINDNLKPKYNLILKKKKQNKNLDEDEEAYFEYIINYVNDNYEDSIYNKFFLEYKELFLK